MKTKVEPTVEDWEEKWHALTCDLIEIISRAGFVKTVPEVNVAFCRWEEKVKFIVSHSVQEAKAEERGIVTDIIKKWVMKTGVTARITTPDTEVVNATELHKLLHSLNVKASLKQEEEKV